jgi:hypothetical protein
MSYGMEKVKAACVRGNLQIQWAKKYCMARESTVGVHRKKIASFICFRNPLRSNPNLATRHSWHQRANIRSHPIRLVRKKEAMMQKASVSRGEPMIDNTVRRRELPCVHHPWYLYKECGVHGAIPMSMERKKQKKG